MERELVLNEESSIKQAAVWLGEAAPRELQAEISRSFGVEIPNKPPRGRIDMETLGTSWFFGSWSCRVPKHFPWELKPPKLSSTFQF
jgi:hypothetical protein